MRWPPRGPHTTSSCSGTRCSSPQVTQASHPGGGGLSVLEHVLGDETTMPLRSGGLPQRDPAHAPDMSVGSSRSRSTRDASSATRAVRSRTPSSAPVCGGWKANHADRSTESEEEAEMVVAEISRLIGDHLDGPAWTIAPLGVGRLHGGGPVQRPGRSAPRLPRSPIAGPAG
jgi:hypothetical protein